MKNVIDLFLRGGVVMWPILGLSIFALALLFWSAAILKSRRIPSRSLTIVSTIITAEPMLGILGTVIGIMQTFRAINGLDGSAANPLAATAGIGEALITTAAGLIASLILIFPYNVLDEKVAKLEEEKTSRDSRKGDDE